MLSSCGCSTYEGYTSRSENRSPNEVISVLDYVFARFDQACEECGLLKVSFAIRLMANEA